MTSVKVSLLLIASLLALRTDATVIGDEEWRLLSKEKSYNLYYSERMSTGDGDFAKTYYFVEDKAGKRHLGIRLIASCKSSEYSLSQHTIIKKNILKSKDPVKDYWSELESGVTTNQAGVIRPFHAANSESDLARLLCRERGFQKDHGDLEQEFNESIKIKANRKIY